MLLANNTNNMTAYIWCSWEWVDQVVKESDPVTLIKGSRVRFRAVTIRSTGITYMTQHQPRLSPVQFTWTVYSTTSHDRGITVYSLVTALYELHMTIQSARGGASVAQSAPWTAGQQVERSILHMGHVSYQTSSHQSRLYPVQFSLTVQHYVLKHNSFHCIVQVLQLHITIVYIGTASHGLHITVVWVLHYTRCTYSTSVFPARSLKYAINCNFQSFACFARTVSAAQ